MKIIPHPVSTTIEVDKSKFHTFFKQVHSLDEAKAFQNQLRKEHPNANHHCMAVVVDDLHYASDDGEPSNTAGQPMLQTLLGHKINEVCCIVVRYFGGTLLGRGGLIRAYGQAVSTGIEAQTFYTYQLVHIKKVTIPYDLMSLIETKIDPKAKIIDRQYDAQMIYTLEVYDESINDELIEMTNNKIKIETLESLNRLVILQ